MTLSIHPFDPLLPEEISRAADVVRPHFAGREINFRVITLREPPKKQMIPFLEKEHRHQPVGVPPTRCARVEVVLESKTGNHELFELLVDLDNNRVTAKQHHKGKHSYIDSDYMRKVENACLADERVQQQIRSLDLPSCATVVVEPWAYATDGMNDMTQRITMNPDANYYAYPLDLCAEVSEQLQVTKVYRLPTSPHERVHNEDRPFDRQRVHDTALSEYHPELRPPPRTTTKPYQVVQPEGPSFKIRGNHLTWEKWSFRVGFNYREGMTLHDIHYDGRSLFYRLALAEMFVPYGDPRAPYPRKAAFDLGNDGAGLNANNLQLGCDCLGTIKYFDGYHNTSTGKPLKMPNVICCHEQDDGILWKHTNFRTGNAVVTRSRILVLQTIITVSNYEYIFAFHFSQDASIFFEVRATGILSTVPHAVGLKEKVPYGTVVAPGVLAPYHQHIFSLRIDPAVDGHANSLVVEESKALPVGDPSVHNPFGVGYIAEQKVVEQEGGFDLDLTKARVFKFINESTINPITNTPVGFKLLPAYSQMLLSHPDSYHAKRSEFGKHAVWVTRYEDDDHFPSGKHTMQSSGGDGIASGIAKRDATGMSHSVRNSDIHAFPAVMSSAAHENEEDDPQRVTTKIGKACEPCRRRKVKCDGAQPCSQIGCQKNPSQCIYRDRTRIRRSRARRQN
ncbi:copper amine oxidase [Verticillium alfalfae VaMs.102]|uniref:Amine oxidase n=1 Tax=Verticillium alfalfae (strain VaMs.102 / ATCC MYA-4576 / FGSC 10136) TaxID=526221 RepID=C9SEI2_VERA1|nr:copper amine oxidase [Verticillium alfalfae VaMs.102]EEY16575.1 copper amine oxidase [Verticillium alfalfae VaMs.102]